MPHLMCPACGLTSYSAAGYTTYDRCPGCDAPLERAKRTQASLPLWGLADLRLFESRKEVEA